MRPAFTKPFTQGTSCTACSSCTLGNRTSTACACASVRRQSQAPLRTETSLPAVGAGGSVFRVAPRRASGATQCARAIQVRAKDPDGRIGSPPVRRGLALRRVPFPCPCSRCRPRTSEGHACCTRQAAHTTFRRSPARDSAKDGEAWERTTSRGSLRGADAGETTGGPGSAKCWR